MPLPRHQLDIIICPAHCEQVLSGQGGRRLLQKWQSHGWIDADGKCVLSHKNAMIQGGFARLFLDQPEGMRFYGNHQGGYYVQCPTNSSNIVPSFVTAMKQWRQNQHRSLHCPSCEQSHDLNDLYFRPPAAFAMGALVIQNVDSTEICPTVLNDLQLWLGDFKLVLKRMG